MPQSSQFRFFVMYMLVALQVRHLFVLEHAEQFEPHM